MLYLLANDGLQKTAMAELNNQEDGRYLALLSFKELEEYREELGVGQQIVCECRRNITKYECHDGFDFIALDIPAELNQSKKKQKVAIYFRRDLLCFVCDDPEFIGGFFYLLEKEGMKDLSLGKALYHFFDRLTSDDVIMLEAVEREISAYEETLIKAKKSNFIDNIVVLRKRLLMLKRYYEQLLEIAEEIEQNENELIEKRTLRYFRVFTKRVERLYHGVLNLRDYVTQVREAYQAQMDISLNRIMEVFTVIAAIFLPLTLIVGWYGMNLKMPEFAWDHGYIYVICLSALTLMGSLLYIKKNSRF